MDFSTNTLYQQDIKKIASAALPWEKLRGKVVFITGVTGLVGTMLADVIMYKNLHDNLNCQIVGVSRDPKKCIERHKHNNRDNTFSALSCDLNLPLDYSKLPAHVDYIVHLASNVNPRLYATDPIGTITTNTFGTDNLLKYGSSAGCNRFLYASSSEIYGENRGDVELMDEAYCGYLDCNTLRACYSESKRCGEALCQAYIAQEEMDVTIARFSRIYGPTIRRDDAKALSQFLFQALKGEDVILKSKGNQHYSYIYAADAVSGLLFILLKGKCGEAYNIADESSNIHLKDLAELIADLAGVKVVFDLPDAVEAAGFSKATKALLDNSKIVNELGWKALYDINAGISRTLEILANQ